jgi:ABC-2 type transport system permease protein
MTTADPTAARPEGAAIPTSGSFHGLGDVKLIFRQFRYEQLSFWLNPVGAFFTIGLSTLLLVLLGSTAGSAKVGHGLDIRLVQYYVPGFVAFGIMSSCFNVLAISMVNRREMGLLKRLRLSPVPTWILMAAIFLSYMFIALVQMVILLVVGKFGFSVHGPVNVLAFLVTVLVGMLVFTALGLATSTVIPNVDAAGPAVSVVFFILVFLSGLYFYIAPGSGLAQFASYFPVRHLILALFASFEGGRTSPWAWGDLGVMAIWGVVGVAVAARRWQWAPRRG